MLFKYTQINTTGGKETEHEIGDTVGGSQDDCIDLCNGAEGCQSIFYKKPERKCHLSSIDVPQGIDRPDIVDGWKTYAKSCVQGVFIYIIINVIHM